jgi:hypothetical protein
MLFPVYLLAYYQRTHFHIYANPENARTGTAAAHRKTGRASMGSLLSADRTPTIIRQLLDVNLGQRADGQQEGDSVLLFIRSQTEFVFPGDLHRVGVEQAAQEGLLLSSARYHCDGAWAARLTLQMIQGFCNGLVCCLRFV